MNMIQEKSDEQMMRKRMAGLTEVLRWSTETHTISSVTWVRVE